MRELFENLKHIDIGSEEAKKKVLIDTCFFIHVFEHQKNSQLLDLTKSRDVAITSFNVEEFLFKEHVVDERVREYARKFLKHNANLNIISIGVSPGNRAAEKEFVNSIDPNLLQEVADASDAVLIAVAIKTGSSVLTKDKHHLFTTKLENYLQKYNIRVYKEFHDVI
jgi:predicted nucleic acid-binding protein